MNIKKALAILCFACLFLGACNSNNTIPVKHMKEIMLEMHIADAVRNINQSGLLQHNRNDSISLYGPILQKYGYTIDDFTKAVTYYASQPEDMREIYIYVTDRFKAMQAEYKILVAQERKERNLWKDADSVLIESDWQHDKVKFNIPTKGKGTYTITVSAQFFPDDSTKNPRMVAWFASNSKPDTIVAKTETKFEGSSTFTLTLQLKDTLMNQLKGQLMEYDAEKGKRWQQHIELKNIYVEYNPNDTVVIKGLDSIDNSKQKWRIDNQFINNPKYKLDTFMLNKRKRIIPSQY